jgi:hypothetical protein
MADFVATWRVRWPEINLIVFALAMAKRRLGGASQPAPKRNNESFAQGEDVFFSYRVPKTKREFAGMRGSAVVDGSSPGSTVLVRFKIPRTSTALYIDHPKGNDDASCTVKFSLAQVDKDPPPMLATKAPFNLTAFQTRLHDHLGHKCIIRLYATAQSTVRRDIISQCLVGSARRVCDLHGPKITCLIAINSAK